MISAFPSAEPVLVQRTGSTVPGLVDPAEHRVYLDAGVDLQAGDTIGFGTYTRRVTELPQLWNAFGVVATFDPAPATLPDLGSLARPTGTPGALDEATGIRAPEGSTPVWTGPCLVEVLQARGGDGDIGDQPVEIVPFVVTVPLTLTDVRAGDLFTVTQSRDTRLLTRTLVVKAIRASSTELVRELLAFDNQG